MVVLSGTDCGWEGQPAWQETVGQFQFPLCWTVKPNVLPLPLGRAVITLPLESHEALVFQVAMIFWGELTVTVTVQLSVPETVTLPLKRSFHFSPSEYVAVQPPGFWPGVVVVVVVGLVPPTPRCSTC